MKRASFLAAAVALAAVLSGCVRERDVPCLGRLTVVPDWSGRIDGADVPPVWTVMAGDYEAVATGPSHTAGRLFPTGIYPVYVYNPADGVTVSGTVVSVAAAADPAGHDGTFVDSAPGWFFSCATEAVIRDDGMHEVVAVMRQQVRPLTLVIDTAAGAPEIESISGTLSGVAGSFDMADGERGAPSNVSLVFVRIVSGPDAGKWAATVRLLGVAGAGQTLKATVRFTNPAHGTAAVESDMAPSLSDFNAEMTEPLTLSVRMDTGVVPDGVDFTAVIDGWTAVAGGRLTPN